MNMRLFAYDINKKIATRQILDGVTLSLKQGEIIGLLGPNGSGKSSLFSIMAGIEKPSSGAIYINHCDITKYEISERSGLGISYLPQESILLINLSVAQNLLAAMEGRKFSYAEKLKKIKYVLDLFKISSLANNLCSSLSGGEKRKVEIAKSVVNNPFFLFLDEPFSGVDPMSISEIRRLIQTLSLSNLGIVITDHNVSEVLQTIQRGYILFSGKLLANGSRHELFANEEVRKKYLGYDYDTHNI
uniref:Probable ATP-dependent transporter ycf16 n=1 Tax=Cyanidium caldarium TaxID=2771 RepID=Q9TLX9_CYACA|nr:sulfate ABC transporter protein [Cyanidium caldarium]AAF12955.1 unknown [Cyanidium caldarium]WDB00262.1 sulfate ABC transporter protein [Cyanidium caldarium]